MEPVMQPATSRAKEVAHEALRFGAFVDGGHGDDACGYGRSGFC